MRGVFSRVRRVHNNIRCLGSAQQCACEPEFLTRVTKSKYYPSKHSCYSALRTSGVSDEVHCERLGMSDTGDLHIVILQPATSPSLRMGRRIKRLIVGTGRRCRVASAGACPPYSPTWIVLYPEKRRIGHQYEMICSPKGPYNTAIYDRFRQCKFHLTVRPKITLRFGQ